jgi:hypothetical protein
VQLRLQAPFTQLKLPLTGFAPHPCPHEPQLARSLLKLTHVPEQLSGNPLSHENAQALFAQTAVPLAVGDGQACPHVWQFRASFA